MSDERTPGYTFIGGNELTATYAIHSGKQRHQVLASTFGLTSYDMRMQWALDLAKSASMAGIPDGEDSAGQAKMRIMTPKEAASHAILIADALFAAGKARGWIYDLDADTIRRLIDEESAVAPGFKP